MIDRRTKMVSFRLSWEEYKALQDACATVGVRSLSELARGAMHHVIASRHNGTSLYEQVCELREQMSLLSREVERIAQRIDREEGVSAAHAQVGGRI
jgi:uncharacterized small protein (DUF1192 family)